MRNSFFAGKFVVSFENETFGKTGEKGAQSSDITNEWIITKLNGVDRKVGDVSQKYWGRSEYGWKNWCPLLGLNLTCVKLVWIPVNWAFIKDR